MRKGEAKDVPIVALTANRDEKKSKCLAVAMCDILYKPLEEEELIRIISKYMLKDN